MLMLSDNDNNPTCIFVLHLTKFCRFNSNALYLNYCKNSTTLHISDSRIYKICGVIEMNAPIAFAHSLHKLTIYIYVCLDAWILNDIATRAVIRTLTHRAVIKGAPPHRLQSSTHPDAMTRISYSCSACVFECVPVWDRVCSKRANRRAHTHAA